MTSLLQLMDSNYEENLLKLKDPEVDSWFLMSSPAPVVTILAAYLYFVLKLGPQYMSTRKPYNLQAVLVAYNFVQVIFSIWLSYTPIKLGAVTHLVNNGCHPSVDPWRTRQISVGAWWYHFAKVVELLDTVFFVLRKKQRQVTFLHVYHHSVTCLFSWCYLKYLPGEQGVVIGFLNSLVHVVMYSYYMIAAMGPNYAKYIWWKKYMTWIQLIQFCLMLTYLASLVVMDCQLSKGLTWFFGINASVFLFLFLDFYRKAYNKKTKTS